MSHMVIDVREPDEYQQGHVEGALNMPLSELIDDPKILSNVPKDSEIILYCNTGNRSLVALQVLQQRGYIHLINGINQSRVKQVINKHS